MKRTIGLLLLTMLLAFSLTACGDADKNTVNDTPNDGVVTDDGTTTNPPATGTVDDGIVNDPTTGTGTKDEDLVNGANGTTGTDGAMTDGTNGTATNQRSLVRGATYDQMLRNARVHDKDGNLRDYENTVTPGTAY